MSLVAFLYVDCYGLHNSSLFLLVYEHLIKGALVDSELLYLGWCKKSVPACTVLAGFLQMTRFMNYFFAVILKNVNKIINKFSLFFLIGIG